MMRYILVILIGFALPALAGIKTEKELRAAIANSQPVIQIEPSAYITITNTVALLDHQRLIGWGATIYLKGDAPEDDPNVAALMLGKDCSVEGLSLTAAKFGVGLTVRRGASRITVNKMTINGFRYGVDLDYCWIINLDNLWISHCWRGIYLHGRSANVVRFDGGTITSSDIGVCVEGANQEKAVISGTIEGNRIGVRIHGEAESMTIRDCYFERNREAAIIVDAYTAHGTIVEANHFRSEKVGVYAATGIGTWVGKNSFVMVDHPILIGPYAQYTVVEWNNLRSTRGMARISAEDMGGYKSLISKQIPVGPPAPQPPLIPGR